MGLFSSSKSSSKTTNNAYDQRQVYDAGGGVIGTGNSLDQSVAVTNNGADASAINAQNTALLRDLGGLQINAIDRAAELGSDLFAVSASNSAQAWNRTLDTSEQLIANLLDANTKTTGAAQSLAGAAIASFMPTDNKNADTMKYAGIAAALVVAFIIFRK